MSGAPGSSSQAGSAFRQQHAPSAPGQVQQVPHPFNLSHLSAALSQPGPVQTPVVPQLAQHHNMQSDWERFQAQSHRSSPQPQVAHPGPQQSAWASDFKGKGREMPQQQHMPQHMEPMMHTPQMMPPSPFSGGMLQTYQPRLQPMYSQPQPVAADHAKMEAAFEAALADARAQAVPQEPEQKEEQASEEQKTEEPKAEEERPFKGDLDAVWESLKPEAERQNKLAEWEAEFSQVSGRQRSTRAVTFRPIAVAPFVS